MARLPQPGRDAGNWGDILNDYLVQSHKADGTLKNDSVGAAAILDGSITPVQLSTSIQATLSKADTAAQPADLAVKYTMPVNGIPLSDMRQSDLDTVYAPISRALPNGGLTGQVIVKTVSGSAWADNVSTEFQISAMANFGDSITAAGQGGGIKWHELVSDWLGIPAYNPSIPGEAPADIAIRQGGLAPQVTLSGDSIPATTDPVSVTAIVPSSGYISNSPGNAERGAFVGRLCGVAGTLLHDQTSGTWTFTRGSAGTVAIPCPPGSRFRTDGGKSHRGDIQTFWGGRNDNSTVLRDTASMVGYLTEPKRFLVLSILTGGADVSGSGGHTSITQRNTQLASTYGSAYVDIRTYLIGNGLSDAGITPTSQDNTDIANNTVPSSLRADNIHPNATGHWVIARKIATEIVDRGWVETSSVYIPAAIGNSSTATVLSMPTSSAVASIAAPAGLIAAENMRIELVGHFNSLVSQSSFVRRSATAGEQRSWQLLSISTQRLRLQLFQSGTSTPVITVDSTIAPTYTPGNLLGIRIDVNAAARSVAFYTSSDGSNWLQLGTTVTGAATSIFDGTAPLEITGFAGDVERVRVSSVDETTVWVEKDFTTGNATGWTLSGGAAIV